MDFRILSCDGGGIRGLMTAIWLSRLEKKLGGPLRNYFDCIAGTSTGSILGCAISLGIPADRIVGMYVERGREVFPPIERRIWDRIQRAFSDGLSAPRYDGRGLERVLQDVFGKARFGDLEVRPTIAISYNTFNRQAVVFKNTRDIYAHLPVWEVVRASCAAPVYFPAHVMNIGQAEIPLIDGGVVANNPTACAVAEGVRFTAENYGTGACEIEDFIVASFGTGQTSKQIGIAEARHWGGLQWVLPVIDVIFDGVSNAVDYVTSHLISRDRYFRFQCRLEPQYDDLDNADPANLNALISTAEAYLNGPGEEMLDDLVKQLKGAETRPNARPVHPPVRGADRRPAERQIVPTPVLDRAPPNRRAVAAAAAKAAPEIAVQVLPPAQISSLQRGAAPEELNAPAAAGSTTEVAPATTPALPFVQPTRDPADINARPRAAEGESGPQARAKGTRETEVHPPVSPQTVVAPSSVLASSTPEAQPARVLPASPQPIVERKGDLIRMAFRKPKPSDVKPTDPAQTKAA